MSSFLIEFEVFILLIQNLFWCKKSIETKRKLTEKGGRKRRKEVEKEGGREEVSKRVTNKEG